MPTSTSLRADTLELSVLQSEGVGHSNMYSRDEVKAVTDKLINMAKADAVEVDFSGGERSATRFANSTITANMVQFDRQVSVTVYKGARSASASTRQFDDASLQKIVDEAQTAAEKARENPDQQPLTEGPQDYIAVDAALPSGVNFGPAERAQARAPEHRPLRQARRGRLRLHPEDASDDLQRELEGVVRVLPVRGGRLHPDVPDAGWRPARAGPGSPASRTPA